MPVARCGILAAVALVWACAHPEPGSFVAARADTVLVAGTVTRLTYNVGEDSDPAWLPDGTAFLYTTQRLDRADRDRCLAMMGAEGGTIRRLICNRAPRSDDSIDVLEAASPAPDGRIIYLYTTFDLRNLTPPRTRDLVMATVDSPLAFRYLIFFPYEAEGGGYTHFSASYVRWLTPGSFVYRAYTPHYPQPCKTCRPDAATPIELVVVDILPDTIRSRPVPGTIYATSVDASGDDVLYYTVLGDGRIYRHVLSTGLTDVIHDFGPGEIARDVQVRSGRLLAVVGGDVSIEFLVGLGFVQNDDGGRLRLLDLGSMAEVPVDDGGRLFRHAALSPDGTTVLAESLVDGAWDIFRVRLP
jgi:hypothetical protein